MCIEIKIFYLDTPLTRYDYIYIPITLIPDKIVQQYNLLPLVRNGFIYFHICKGMSGLHQYRRLSNDILTKRLNPKGYVQFKNIPGIW